MQISVKKMQVISIRVRIHALVINSHIEIEVENLTAELSLSLPSPLFPPFTLARLSNLSSGRPECSLVAPHFHFDFSLPL